MNKHLFAIFTYFATFFFSFLLVSLLTERPAMKATSCFPARNVMRPAHSYETAEQKQIKRLLALDRTYGLEYFAGPEQAADTELLVEKMRSLDSAGLPLPVRKAYRAHTDAWSDYARHIKNSSNHDYADRDCIALNRGINETYNTLLLAAKNYGVDFED